MERRKRSEYAALPIYPRLYLTRISIETHLVKCGLSCGLGDWQMSKAILAPGPNSLDAK